MEIGANLKLTSGFPFSSRHFSTEDGFPLIRIRDILTSKIETFYRGPHALGYVVKKGDILIGMDGDFNIVKWKNSDALLNQRILKVDVADPSSLNLGFIYYWLDPYVRKINDVTAATTVKHLSIRDIARASDKLPCVDQQKKIAAILAAIDTAIEKTEALIEKYQQIKTGLMHDLFTRGALPSGQLRPTREQSPELYQKTAIGWIPKEWEICRLNEKINPARPIVYGILMPGYGFPGGVPVVKVKDIRNRSIKIDGLLLTSPAIDQEYRRSRLKEGDVLFTIRGTVGRVAVVSEQLECANITQDTARIDLIGVHNGFASLYFETAPACRFFEINTLGVAVQGINLGELRKLPIPVPTMDEQERIYERLVSTLNRLDTETRSCSKLAAQKVGLMHDLLTGKVRVKVETEAAEPVSG